MRSNKGSIPDIIMLSVILLVGSICLPILYTAYSQVQEGILGVDNVPQVVNSTMGSVSDQMDSGMLDYFFFGVFIMVSIAILILAYASDNSAPWFILYLIITVITTLLAIPFSNAYQTMAGDSHFSTFVTNSFTYSNYIMENLPVFILVVGILTSIIMYGKLRGEAGRV